MAEVFPYEAHWKTDACHRAYWEYEPTIDHIYPLALGGKDTEENWATTSMVHNDIKSGFTLEQVGWTLKPRGTISQWDGLSRLLTVIAEKDRTLLENKRIRAHYEITKKWLQWYDLHR